MSVRMCLWSRSDAIYFRMHATPSQYKYTCVMLQLVEWRKNLSCIRIACRRTFNCRYVKCVCVHVMHRGSKRLKTHTTMNIAKHKFEIGRMLFAPLQFSSFFLSSIIRLPYSLSLALFFSPSLSSSILLDCVCKRKCV